MIKDIIANVSAGPRGEAAANYAISVAKAFEAHLAGVAFAFEPVIAPTIMGGVPAGLVDGQRAEAEAAANEAIAKFDAAIRLAGISAESRVITASLAGAADVFGRIARRFDLSIVCQAEPNKVAAGELIIEGTLFESGRPVVVVPYIQKTGLKLDRVVICWDASRTAARAVGDAMPFLVRTKAIDLVIVTSEKLKSDPMPGAGLTNHLARHGLKVELQRIVASGKDVASTILSHAAETSTDLLVMGGYGHSRLREFILGGATRGILSAMTVPVLMSH